MKSKWLVIFGLFWSVVFFSGFRPISVDDLGEAREIALEGYDTVAYFLEGKAVKGRPLLSMEWMGARWYFSKTSHLELFRLNPEKYAPRYGGYCAFCLAESEAAQTPGNPRHFIIWKDKLYLLQSAELVRKWEENLESYAEKADALYDEMLKEYLEENSEEVAKRSR